MEINAVELYKSLETKMRTIITVLTVTILGLFGVMVYGAHETVEAAEAIHPSFCYCTTYCTGNICTTICSGQCP